MCVPIFDLRVALEALNFADKVALDVGDSVLADDAVFAPLVQVLSVKVCVESLGQKVKIDIVIFEQVKHIEGSDSRHLFFKLIFIKNFKLYG